MTMALTISMIRIFFLFFAGTRPIKHITQLLNKVRLGTMHKQKYLLDLLHMKKEYRPITIHAMVKCHCHAGVYTWPKGMCTNFFLILVL